MAGKTRVEARVEMEPSGSLPGEAGDNVSATSPNVSGKRNFAG